MTLKKERLQELLLENALSISADLFVIENEKALCSQKRYDRS